MDFVLIMKNYQILLIEDDLPLAELTKEFLVDYDFIVTIAETGEQAVKFINQHDYDLIICDVNLPDIQGFDLIESLNLPYLLPVIFLTALSDIDSQITGLEAGACDYIVKPVEPELLLARVKAHLRHSSPVASGDVVQVGELHLDNVNKKAKFQDSPINLTNQEFDVLWFFTSVGDNVVSREQIFTQLIGREYDGSDRAADLRVSRFRKKMQQLGCEKLTVDSIRNQGYVFNFWAHLRETK